MQDSVVQISGDGHKSYLVYSSDTGYQDELAKRKRQDKNYHATIKYRRGETEDFDISWFNRIFR